MTPPSAETNREIAGSLVTGNDELGWPIHDKDGNIVLSRSALFTSMGRLWLATMFLLGLQIARVGWTAAHHRPAWPTHFVFATIAWTVFTVPVGWVAWSFWRVIRLFARDDAANERLRQLRKHQELEDRERRERMKEFDAMRADRRRRGAEIAQQIAERRRVLKGQEQIEEDLG